MPRYDLTDPKDVADLLAGIDFTIVGKSKGTFSPDHMAYHCNLSKGDAAFGTILDEQHVPYGEDATAPEDPTLRGHEFIGWDKDFTDVTEDLTVVALFEGVPVTTVGTYGKTGGSDAGVKTAVAALVLVAGGAAAYGVLQLRKDRRETPHE